MKAIVDRENFRVRVVNDGGEEIKAGMAYTSRLTGKSFAFAAEAGNDIACFSVERNTREEAFDALVAHLEAEVNGK